MPVLSCMVHAVAERGLWQSMLLVPIGIPVVHVRRTLTRHEIMESIARCTLFSRTDFADFWTLYRHAQANILSVIPCGYRF